MIKSTDYYVNNRPDGQLIEVIPIGQYIDSRVKAGPAGPAGPAGQDGQDGLNAILTTEALRADLKESGFKLAQAPVKIPYTHTDGYNGMAWDDVNFRFTATTRGLYAVYCQVWMVEAFLATIYLRRNGGNIAYGRQSERVTAQIYDEVLLEVGQYVEVFGDSNSGTPTVQASATQTYITVRLVADLTP